MQNTRITESESKIVFQTKIEDIPGGVTVSIAGVKDPTIPAGTPVGKDPATGLFKIVKKAADATGLADLSVTGHTLDVVAGDNHLVEAIRRGTIIKANGAEVIDEVKALFGNRILWV